MDADATEKYSASDLVHWLHEFPHIDMYFTKVNDTFAPTNYKYREALYFLSALPVAWLILTLVVLSVYMCFRCCWCVSKAKTRKGIQKTCCLHWAVILFILICGILLSLSFYGNEQANEGITAVVTSIRHVNRTIEKAGQKMYVLDSILTSVNNSGAKSIWDVVDQNVSNRTVRMMVAGAIDRLREHCTTSVVHIDAVQSDLDTIHLDKIVKIAKIFEFYRWIATIAVLCLVVVICLGFLIGAVKKSRGILIATIAMNVACLVLLFSASGFYLALTVASADFCVAPDDFLEGEADKQFQALVKTYLACSNDPFSESIATATTGLRQANTTLSDILTLVAPFHIGPKLLQSASTVQRDIGFGLGNLTRLGSLIGCSTVHDDYTDALYGLCDKALLGMVFIMLTSAVIGISFSIMICLASTLWRQYKSKSEAYDSDDSDPFVPRPPPYNGYGAVLTESVASIHDNSRADVRLSDRSSGDMGAYSGNSALHPGGSPPPAYNTNRARQYNVSYRRTNTRELPWGTDDRRVPYNERRLPYNYDLEEDHVAMIT